MIRGKKIFKRAEMLNELDTQINNLETKEDKSHEIRIRYIKAHPDEVLSVTCNTCFNKVDIIPGDKTMPCCGGPR